jgi:pimeloyl-ACP methyl ester carboxylesterase
MWDDIAPRLAERWRVLNVEARGHGHSTAPGPFSLEDLACDWLHILDQEQLPRATLCGLSMGGMTAMRLALTHPDRVQALALLDTSADEELPHWRRFEYKLLGEVVRTVGHLPPILDLARKKLIGRSTLRSNPEVGDRVVGYIRGLDRRQLYHALSAVFDRASITHRIGEIRCPTLVLCGGEDVSTIPARSETIVSRIAGSRLKLLPRVGHLSAIEAPDAVLAELEPFFARALA